MFHLSADTYLSIKHLPDLTMKTRAGGNLNKSLSPKTKPPETITDLFFGTEIKHKRVRTEQRFTERYTTVINDTLKKVQDDTG